MMKTQETIYINNFEQDTLNDDDDLFLCVRLQRSLGMNKISHHFILNIFQDRKQGRRFWLKMFPDLFL